MRTALLYVEQPIPPPPPLKPAPRYWRGNFCGVRANVKPVDGGGDVNGLVLSWFYDRYDAGDRATIRATWKAKGYTHVVLSWPDSRAFGKTAQQFGATCRELIADGFYPCPFLYSKDFDPPNVSLILAGLADVLLELLGVVPMVCIGWELSIALSPTQVQQLIDAVAPIFVKAGARVYVHFQAHYFSFSVEHWDDAQQKWVSVTADFWNANRGKLTGLLAQFDQENVTDHDRLDWINDCLERCAGNDGMPSDIIDGHPVDFVGMELTAIPQFGGSMTEAEGDRIGRVVINAPPRTGPAGTVVVMGSGNGS